MNIDTQGWHRQARLIRSPNYNDRPDGVAPELIVLHSLSLPPGCYGTGLIDRFFTNRLDSQLDPALHNLTEVRVSAHFFISRWGELTQFVACHDRAWHAGLSTWRDRADCNNYALGIELEGRIGDSYTDDQYQRLSRLCTDLIVCYSRLNSQSIVGHQHIAPERKDDPGVGFDWALLWQMLTECAPTSGQSAV